MTRSHLCFLFILLLGLSSLSAVIANTQMMYKNLLEFYYYEKLDTDRDGMVTLTDFINFWNEIEGDEDTPVTKAEAVNRKYFDLFPIASIPHNLFFSPHPQHLFLKPSHIIYSSPQPHQLFFLYSTGTNLQDL